MIHVVTHEFDVVPIAAGGGLAVLLAVVLGGHLQVLFAVMGNRRRHDANWRERIATIRG
jgi:hypothetical protein